MKKKPSGDVPGRKLYQRGYLVKRSASLVKFHYITVFQLFLGEKWSRLFPGENFKTHWVTWPGCKSNLKYYTQSQNAEYLLSLKLVLRCHLTMYNKDQTRLFDVLTSAMDKAGPNLSFLRDCELLALGDNKTVFLLCVVQHKKGCAHWPVILGSISLLPT